MYLSANNQSFEVYSDATALINEPAFNVAYNDHTSAGMVLPQSNTYGKLTGSTPVTILSAPAAGVNRQAAIISIYNADTATRVFTIQKDVAGTKYVIIKTSVPSGATLFYSREHGWIIDNGTATIYNITEFTANGTWTKPANLKFAWVYCIAGGGGGGSGRRGAAGTNRYGGGGGSGGATVTSFYASSELSSSYAVIIGLGGAGGASVLVDDTNGNNGSNGNDTSFGALLIAKGGIGGNGGSAANGTGGLGVSQGLSTPSYLPYTLYAGDGGNGQTSSAGSLGSQSLVTAYAAGGTGGSGINSADVANTASCNGSSTRIGNALINPLVTTGTSAKNNFGRMLFSSQSIIPINGLGSGAFGGNVNSRNGGNGGMYGAGGGGGSGVLNGTSSGQGGNGGDGLCLILELF